MTSRILAAAILVAAGFILAAPLIVSGQIILVFLDMRRRLARLDRRAGRWERQRPAPRAAWRGSAHTTMSRLPYLLPWVRVLLLIRSITSTPWGEAGAASPSSACVLAEGWPRTL